MYMDLRWDWGRLVCGKGDMLAGNIYIYNCWMADEQILNSFSNCVSHLPRQRF